MAFWRRKKSSQHERPRADGVAGSTSGIGGTDEIGVIVERYIIEIGRKELYEDGFEFCGAAIEAGFASAGQQIRLDHDRNLPDHITIADDEITRWLWVDETCLVEEYNVYVELRARDGSTIEFRGLDWDLIAELRSRFRDESDLDRNWHLGTIDEGYLLILCRPDQLETVQANPGFEGFSTADLTDVEVVRRFTS